MPKPTSGVVTKCECRVLEKNEYPEWNKLIAQAPTGTIYSETDYLRILGRAVAAPVRVWGVFSGGQLRGGLASLLLPARDARRSIYNRYLLYYVGLVFDSACYRHARKGSSEYATLAKACIKSLAGEKGLAVSLNQFTSLDLGEVGRDMRPFLDAGWHVHPSYSYCVLLDNERALWERLDKNVRRLVRRAETEGYTVSKSLDFAEFDTLHEELRRRKGSPRYLPSASFREFLASLQQANLGTIYRVVGPSGETAGAQLVLRGTCNGSHTVAAVSVAEHLESGANSLLRWRVFQELRSAGVKWNDLTNAELSDVGRFKARLGGVLQTNFRASKPRTAVARGVYCLYSAGHKSLALLGGKAE